MFPVTLLTSESRPFIILLPETLLPETERGLAVPDRSKKGKTEERGPGRPRKYESAADRVAAFRARAKYPGHRYDIYLGEHAHAALSLLMKKGGLSASKVFEGILGGSITLPETNTEPSQPVRREKPKAKGRMVRPFVPLTELKGLSEETKAFLKRREIKALVKRIDKPGL